ncbi:MAG TPA: hypothetical protein VLA08_06950 [Nitrosopumilus sp.]|nr:hypothetical protein [Nitrosopumilus sp.]
MDCSNMTIEQIETIEIIEWNLDNYYRDFYIEYPENQFDLLFLDIQDVKLRQNGKTPKQYN